jgi:hypothetical protein
VPILHCLSYRGKKTYIIPALKKTNGRIAGKKFSDFTKDYNLIVASPNDFV